MKRNRVWFELFGGDYEEPRAVADPLGEGLGAQGLPYFWTKLRPEGMRKISFKTVPPPYLRVARPPPPPPAPPPQHTLLSEGLDLPLKGSRNRDSTVGRNYE